MSDRIWEKKYDEPLYHMDDEEDSLYNLEDEGENEDLQDERSDEEYESDQDEESDDDYESEDIPKRKKAGISILFYIMTSPVEGWKELKRRRLQPENVASSCFNPVILLAAISPFVKLVYGTLAPVGDLIVEAVILGISLFFGYFTVLLLSPFFMPKDYKKVLSSDIGKEFAMINISTLALFNMTYNCFPMIDPVLVFLPLWTIYLICKGVKILRIDPDKATRVKVILSMLIIGAPILWEWLLTEMLG